MSIICSYHRRKTCSVRVGDLMLGSDYPIRIQSMANTSTDDVDGSVAQAERMVKAGAELIRFTTQGIRQVDSLAQIRSRLLALHPDWTTPIVADVHFQADVADAAARTVEKVRINPGNYVDPARKFLHIDYTQQSYQAELERLSARFSTLISICRTHHTALRLGVNHGSLSDRILSRYGDTPEGMVESVMEFLRVAVREAFHDVVISIKASNTRVMVETVRLLVDRMNSERMVFPLHLGVTEAGEGEDGRLKSAVGIGALLADGIGDTVRVSLSEAPENELSVARALVDYFVDVHSPRYAETTQVDFGGGVLTWRCDEMDWSRFGMYAAAECGRLLWQYNVQELRLLSDHFELNRLEALSRDILQAAGVKRYKTEFVSCPGCGRTLFELEDTIARIKTAFEVHKDEFSHLKIAVMGCIVNGPGEMADADYGYVGAGRGRVSLYCRKKCVLKNIPQEEAVERLMKLIRERE